MSNKIKSEKAKPTYRQQKDDGKKEENC